MEKKLCASEGSMDSFHCALESLRKQRMERERQKEYSSSDSSGSESESIIERLNVSSDEGAAKADQGKGMTLRSGRRKSAIFVHREAAEKAEKVGSKSKQKIRKGVKVDDDVYFMFSNDDDDLFGNSTNQLYEESHHSRQTHDDRYGSETSVHDGGNDLLTSIVNSSSHTKKTESSSRRPPKERKTINNDKDIAEDQMFDMNGDQFDMRSSVKANKDQERTNNRRRSNSSAHAAFERQVNGGQRKIERQCKTNRRNDLSEDENIFEQEVPISYKIYSDRERNYTDIKGVGAKQQLGHAENTMMIRPERLQRNDERYAVSSDSGDDSDALSTEENGKFEHIGLGEDTSRHTTNEREWKPTRTTRLTRHVSADKPIDKVVDDEIQRLHTTYERKRSVNKKIENENSLDVNQRKENDSKWRPVEFTHCNTSPGNYQRIESNRGLKWRPLYEQRDRGCSSEREDFQQKRSLIKKIKRADNQRVKLQGNENHQRINSPQSKYSTSKSGLRSRQRKWERADDEKENIRRSRQSNALGKERSKFGVYYMDKTVPESSWSSSDCEDDCSRKSEIRQQGRLYRRFERDFTRERKKKNKKDSSCTESEDDSTDGEFVSKYDRQSRGDGKIYGRKGNRYRRQRSQSYGSKSSADGGRGAKRPIVQPEKFNGEGVLEDYIEHFEACADVNKWDNNEKAKFLAVSLTGQAREQLQGVSLIGRRAYEKLVGRLQKRYGPGGHTRLHRSNLRARRQRENEGLRELGQAIRVLTRQAYPQMDEFERDMLAKDHFLDALEDEELCRYVTLGRTNTLEETVTLALEYEAMLKVEKMRHRRFVRTTQVHWNYRPNVNSQSDFNLSRGINSNISNPIAVTAMTKSPVRNITTTNDIRYQSRQMGNNQPAERISTPHGLNETAEIGRPRASFRCYNCGQEGHISRRCPQPQRQRAAQNRSNNYERMEQQPQQQINNQQQSLQQREQGSDRQSDPHVTNQPTENEYRGSH